MKHRALFLFLFGLLSTIQAKADSGQFCVQTFNVYATAYASGVQQRLSKLADTLTTQPCDVIQFQEFWRETDFRQFSTEFARADMDLVYADTLRRDRAMIGLTSAFHGTTARKYSELYHVNNEDGFLDWFRNLSGVQKGLTEIEAKLDHGPNILFLNTHTHPTNEAIRAAQMVQLANTVLIESPNAATLPVIFTGDINSTPTSLELSILEKVLLLRDAYEETHGKYGSECTYCESNPLSWGGGDRVIDFTLFRNSPTVTLKPLKSEINLQGTQGNPLSDHYGVRSQMAFVEHNEELLPADSALVLDRKAYAIKALENARQIMVAAQKDVFEQSIQQADALIQKLRTGLPAAAELIYRTP
ncbi:MAG: endonuclease/exonuclease/phosphatase family protein [Bdellovibrionota bacterium]